MCQNCRYPRQLDIGDRVRIFGIVVEVIKTNVDVHDNDATRKWYTVRAIDGDNVGRVSDMPCSTLCSVSPEGNIIRYSYPLKCVKCQKTIRLTCPEGVNPASGYWSCPDCGMQYPFVFYKIDEDTAYTESARKAPATKSRAELLKQLRDLGVTHIVGKNKNLSNMTESELQLCIDWIKKHDEDCHTN